MITISVLDEDFVLAYKKSDCALTLAIARTLGIPRQFVSVDYYGIVNINNNMYITDEVGIDLLDDLSCEKDVVQTKIKLISL